MSSADAAAAAPAAAAPQPEAAPTSLVVHHLNHSRSQRVLWLLEELEVPYQIKHYARVNGRAPKELLDIHPLGKSPVITDNGKVIAESGAIIDYIIKKYGNGRAVPVSEDDKLADLYWSHFAEGSAMNWLVMKLIFSMAPQRAPWLLRPLFNLTFGGVGKVVIDPEMEKLNKFVGAEVTKRDNGNEWLAGGDKDGNPTAADFQMMFVIDVLAAGRGGEALPSTVNFAKKIHARPAYQRALEKGGEYAYGKL